MVKTPTNHLHQMRFQEIDYQQTPIGQIILRRRTMATLDNLEIHEIILNEEFLMSSLFTEVEEQLSKIGIAQTQTTFPNTKLDIAIGGLGLGYTAKAALEHESISELIIIDYLQPVIDWHKQHLVPLGKQITSDPRTTIHQADFFQAASTNPDTPNLHPTDPTKKFHAILLDIDHTHSFLLNDTHGGFYQPKVFHNISGRRVIRISKLPFKDIVTGPPEQHIGTRATNQGVIPIVANQQVITVITFKGVIGLIPENSDVF